jgi:hypothetical protein
MITGATTSDVSSALTVDEWDALRLLHERYRRTRDLFSDHEMGRLRVVRCGCPPSRRRSGETRTDV